MRNHSLLLKRFSILSFLFIAACASTSDGDAASDPTKPPGENTPPTEGSPGAVSCPATPDPLQSLVSENGQFISAVAVDDTHVYYTTEAMENPGNTAPSTNTLKRAPLKGGASEELTKTGRVLELVVTAENVFWISTGPNRQLLNMLPKKTGAGTGAGEAKIISEPNQSPTHLIRASNDDLYFDSYPDGRIFRRAKDGTTTVVVSETREHLGMFLADGDSLFVTQVSAMAANGFVGQTSLYARPLDGSGAERTLYGPFDKDSLGVVAVDDKNVFVTRDQSIARLPKQGGEAVLIPTGSETKVSETNGGMIIGGAFELQVDATSLVWLEMNIDTSPMTGNVVRKDKDKSSAPRTLLAERVGLPKDLKLDACHVYWSGQSGKSTSIYRIGK